MLLSLVVILLNSSFWLRRIHFLIVIRNFYISLLREQMSLHLGSQQLQITAALPSKVGERKCSFSSASSGTSASDFVSCFPSTNKSLWVDTKHLNEKMA